MNGKAKNTDTFVSTSLAVSFQSRCFRLKIFVANFYRSVIWNLSIIYLEPSTLNKTSIFIEPLVSALKRGIEDEIYFEEILELKEMSPAHYRAQFMT